MVRLGHLRTANVEYSDLNRGFELSLMEDVGRALGDHGGPFEFAVGEHGFITRIVSDNGEWTLAIRVVEETAQILSYGIPDYPISHKDRPALLEVLTRINFGLASGCYELDLDDGELRFRTSVDLGDAPFHAGLIRTAVMATVLGIERYLPAVEAVLHGQAARRAIEIAEADWDMSAVAQDEGKRP